MIQSLNDGTSTVSFFLALLELLRRGEAGGVEGVAGDELEVELDELVEELELEDSEEDLGFFDRAARPRPRPPRPRSRPRPRPLGCGSRGSRGILSLIFRLRPRVLSRGRGLGRALVVGREGGLKFEGQVGFVLGCWRRPRARPQRPRPHRRPEEPGPYPLPGARQPPRWCEAAKAIRCKGVQIDHRPSQKLTCDGACFAATWGSFK